MHLSVFMNGCVHGFVLLVLLEENFNSRAITAMNLFFVFIELHSCFQAKAITPENHQDLVLPLNSPSSGGIFPIVFVFPSSSAWLTIIHDYLKLLLFEVAINSKIISFLNSFLIASPTFCLSECGGMISSMWEWSTMQLLRIIIYYYNNNDDDDGDVDGDVDGNDDK